MCSRGSACTSSDTRGGVRLCCCQFEWPGLVRGGHGITLRRVSYKLHNVFFHFVYSQNLSNSLSLQFKIVGLLVGLAFSVLLFTMDFNLKTFIYETITVY